MAAALRRTSAAVAAGTRSLIPPALAVALFAAGGLGLAFLGVIVASEPETGDETIALAVLAGFLVLAVAVAWGAGVLALTLHVLGRHLGRSDQDDPTG